MRYTVSTFRVRHSVCLPLPRFFRADFRTVSAFHVDFITKQVVYRNQAHYDLIYFKKSIKNVPSWAKGNKPYKNENGKDFAKRLCDEHYGEGNYNTKTPGEPYNKIKKWGDRGFE